MTVDPPPPWRHWLEMMALAAIVLGVLSLLFTASMRQQHPPAIVFPHASDYGWR